VDFDGISIGDSAVSFGEGVADGGEVVPHSWGTGDVEPFDESGEVAGEAVPAGSADHDGDASVGGGASDVEVLTDRDSEQGDSVGCAGRVDLDG
jgi:hypothetical protein